MPCPTCGHTMQNLGLSEEPVETVRRVYWCPRCGTLREEINDAAACQTNDEAPKLVARCREFEDQMPPSLFPRWKQTGVAESLYPPGERAYE